MIIRFEVEVESCVKILKFNIKSGECVCPITKSSIYEFHVRFQFNRVIA